MNTTNSKPKLYSYYRSSCSYRVRLALSLKEIDYELIPINLIKNGGEQNSVEFAKLNPKCEVPLWVEGNWHLSQSMAILNYLEESYPQIPLIPNRIKEKANYLELCQIINSGIQPLQNLRVLQYVTNTYKDANQNDWAKHWIQLGLKAFYERWLQLNPKRKGPWSMGESASLVDVFLIPQLYNALRYQLDQKDYPELFVVYQFALGQSKIIQASPEKQIDCPLQT